MGSHAIGRRTGRHGGSRAALALTVASAFGLTLAPAVEAAGGVELSTPYAAVAVEPGTTASFDLTLASSVERRVDLAVTSVPSGWKATIRGGGFVVDGVTAGPGRAPEISLDVEVPDSARDGRYRVSVRASGGGAAVDTLEVDLRVTAEAGGSVTLSTDNQALRDNAEATFNYTLELRNDTPRDLTFGLTAQGPSGWDVTANPSGQTQAASFVVNAGSSTNVTVAVNPPDTVDAGTYPVTVEAAAGDQKASIELQAEIVGQVQMTLTTPDQRLSTNATAGSQKDFQVVVENNGTAPLTGVALSGSAPTDWKITFDEVPDVAPGQSQVVTAHLVPSGSAVAGDYVVTVSASGPEGGSESIQMRVTVETAGYWFLVGLGLIILTVVGLGWAFARYGRR